MTIRIGYHNLLPLAATVTPSSEATAGPKENAYDNLPRDWWISTGAATESLTFDFGAAKDLDYLALYSFDLAGGQIALQWSADGATGWTDIIAAFTPATAVVFKSFASLSKRYVRLIVTGATGPVSVGCAWVGQMLDTGKYAQIGHAPVLAQPVAGKTNISDGGYPLGSTIKTVPAPYSLIFARESPAFVRSTWIPFFEHANAGRPFVSSWDEASYPNEAVFAWIPAGDMKLPAYKRSTLMDFQIKGVAVIQ